MKTKLLPGVFALMVLAATGSSQDQKKSAVKKVEIDKNVTLEIEGDKRRVLVESYVCLRQGPLEQLLTKKFTKEHEAILAADIKAEKIHAALLAAGAEPGKPVEFRDPKPIPPSGTTIKITLEYKDKGGKTVRVPAQQWIRYVKSKKDLDHDWVFAGSRLFIDPDDKKKPPNYLANIGDVICVANFDTAMLDLPIDSSKDNDSLAFEAHTDRIPPLKTPVTLILEPVLKKKKK